MSHKPSLLLRKPVKLTQSFLTHAYISDLIVLNIYLWLIDLRIEVIYCAILVIYEL